MPEIPATEPSVTETSVTETVVIPGVTPAEVFDHLTHPANHVPDGSRSHPSVVGPIGASRLTAKGDRFGMRMTWNGLPYRITNTVVEFEADRRIAWRHFGGHRWRYELEQVGDGTRVAESFDLSPVPSPFRPVYRRVFGFPRAYAKNLRESLAELRDRLAA